MLETAIVVKVNEGLHARPATQFAKLAKEFSCSLQIFRGSTCADAKSAVKLMLLGVKQDDQILLRADGSDESDAVRRLLQFLSEPTAGVTLARHDGAKNGAGTAAGQEAQGEAVAVASNGTHHEPAAAQDVAPASSGCDASTEPPVHGVPASEGLACGPAFVYLPEELRATRQFIEPDEVESELARFGTTFRESIAALDQQFEAMGQHDDIVEALADVAQSDDFSGAVKEKIAAGWDAAAATLQVGEELSAAFLAMDDEYLRSRADDIRGIARQVALRLLGKEDVSLAALAEPCVVLAADLTALDFARAKVANIVGLVCTKGSATSHLAIMARAHGIPAVLGLPVPEELLREASRVALDGAHGQVWFDPSPEWQTEFDARIAQERRRHAALSVYRDVSPVTSDGRHIEIAANLGSLAEIDAALEAGAMGVGLFRTELLFMDRRTLPDEDEQYDVYRRLAEAFHPRPVVIRTLDVGGDKPVPGIAFPHEDNPFLGWRGVRMCLDRPDVFEPQLRALLRAATLGNVHVMLPMVDDLDEIRRAKVMLENCAQALRQAGVACAMPKLGIMVETPAAALTADLLAPEVDFFSIGTNDLTQYVMAVDRVNASLASLYRTDHPAVLRAIGMVCEAAKRANISVAVCGEAAARPDMIPVLVGLGVNELSMSPSSVLRAKKIVSEL
ncbi:phosphoenolpyruvate--protein phosphotransferase [Paraburkholderia sp. DHOC27]|uniref:phosphoenolpyruvate--protein phosphotransferase n=1 Tax=Paraburkholderia sp. DHOC27 TaxID=2303330 RepID=UPI000E3C5101|nr:phosphoenolpyruvate--protein phosphotransferase [Paraburkholderia sp. DHOC27]RFU49394.1 phosphoenolpyruvate--protein phosphotransferase [Paraburkholderia sp. DHOC27]